MISLHQALGFSFATQYLSQIVQFIAVVIIARVLTPEEIGIYAVGAVVILVAISLRQFGGQQYIVSAKELTVERLKKVTGVMVIMSGAMFFC